MRRRDEGFTLMEVLVTLFVMGTGVLAVVAALQFSVDAVANQRALALSEAALLGFAEDIRGEPYYDTDRDYGGDFDAGDVVVSVEEVRCWTGDLSSATPYVPCGPGDTGAQLIRIRAEGPLGIVLRTDVVKRAD